MIKAIIWDLGGVLIEDPKYKEFWSGVSNSEELRIEFGSGRIDSDEFVRRGAVLFGCSKNEFLERYKKFYWTGERNEEVIQIFMRVPLKNYIYSDTNAIHIGYLKRVGKDLFEKAERVFSDRRKKFLESYKSILVDIGLDPSEVVFVDNKSEYVELARSLGIYSILYEDCEGLRKEIEKLGVCV